MYDCPVRRLVIVCMLFAGARAARADTPGSTVADRQLAEARCAAHDPTCDWFSTLGSLERTTVQRALIKRGYELEPAPWGKVIGKVHVYNEEVFAEGGHLLQFLNNFHVTTKERAVRNEAVVQDGELWDDERIAETARRLRDPLWSSVIAVVPVKSTEPGKVDVLVVTRDVWSLRFNTKYTFQAGKLTNLQMSLSENNFLGRRNVFAAAVTMDQGAIAVGPLFLASNVLDRTLRRLDQRARHPLARRSAERQHVSPRGLVELDRDLAPAVVARHQVGLRRLVPASVRDQPRVHADPPAPGPVPRRWRLPNARGRRARRRAVPVDLRDPHLGRPRVRRAAVGHAVEAEPHLRPHGRQRTATPPRRLRRHPGAGGRVRRCRVPSLRGHLGAVRLVHVFTPTYRTRRNVQTYDLAEDLRLGPSVDATFGVGLKALGSDANFQRGGLTGGWTFPWCRDGIVTLSSGINGRYQATDFIDNTANVSTRIVTPLWPQGRFVIESTLATRWHDTQNSSYGIGGDPRPARLRHQPVPRPARVQHAGRGALALDTRSGCCASAASCSTRPAAPRTTLRAITPHQDVGLGVRVLIPQTSRELFRFDIAVPARRYERRAIRGSSRASIEAILSRREEAERRGYTAVTVRPADRPHHRPGAPRPAPNPRASEIGRPMT